MTISMRRFVPAVSVVLLSLLLTATAFAALSSTYTDFAKGPAQWLMTNEEKSAWKSVSTDEQAERFVELFWARRDPTPGTPRNEYKEEFEGRVITADAAFHYKDKRGSLTDRGRVFVLLGPPANFAASMANKLDNAATNVGDSATTLSDVTSMQAFDYADRTRQLGLIGPVKFAENPSTREYHIDFQQGNVSGALNQAVKRAVVNANLNEVPDWAKPQTRTEIQMLPTGGATTTTTETTATGTVKKTTTIINANVPVATEPAGAKTLILTKDVFAIDSQAAKNPLASMTSAPVFTNKDELGFAAQYCSGKVSDSAPSIKEQLTITGAGADGKRVRMSAPEEEMTPDALKSMTGCYLVRGSLPLSDLAPGTYKLTMRITDPSSGQSYSLDRDFSVQ